MHAPCKSHVFPVKHIFRLLQSTIDHWLFFKVNSNLILWWFSMTFIGLDVFTIATLLLVFMFSWVLISFLGNPKKQLIMSRSSIDCAAAYTIVEIQYVCQLLFDLGILVRVSVHHFCDYIFATYLIVQSYPP